MKNLSDKKKNNSITLIIYAVIAVFAIAAGIIVGRAVDLTLTDEGRPDAMAAANEIENVIKEPMPAFKYALENKKSYSRKGGLCGGIVVMIYFAYKSTTKKRYHRKGVEHGSAHWGGKKEKELIRDSKDLYNNIVIADDIYIVLDRKKREENKNPKKKKPSDNSPVGNAAKNKPSDVKLQEKKDNSPVGNKKPQKETMVSISKKSVKAKEVETMLNLNVLVIGGTGTGKSRFFVKPNLLQCNTSFVVTDPSGELLQSCGKMLERNGYKIKVFNLMDMKYSSNYNPFRYIFDSDGKYSANNVIKMINTFIINTKQGEGSSSDPFWDEAAKQLLSAVSFLLVEVGEEEDRNLANVLELIGKAKSVEGKENDKSELDLIFDERRAFCPDALSVKYYDKFKQAGAKTIQSILITTTTKLQFFMIPSVRDLTHKDTIQLETIGDEKTALFIIIPSTDTTYNFLAAMMYTQLFDTLFDRAIHNGGKLNIHTRFILDEFANVGKIPNFETVLATMRKFEISAAIILQNMAQLKRLYEKSWEEIPGNCDTMLYLGGKDQSTNKYIVEDLGKETIDTLSVNKTKSKQGSTTYNDGILGRELMQLNELQELKNSECIVMIRSLPPFKTLKYRLEKHPRYNQLEECDRKNNTYPLNSICTEKELELLELSQEAVPGEYSPEDYEAVSDIVVNIYGGKQPEQDNEIFISEETQNKFSPVTGVYFKTIR